jgi:hypothetical protein
MCAGGEGRWIGRAAEAVRCSTRGFCNSVSWRRDEEGLWAVLLIWLKVCSNGFVLLHRFGGGIRVNALLAKPTTKPPQKIRHNTTRSTTVRMRSSYSRLTKQCIDYYFELNSFMHVERARERWNQFMVQYISSIGAEPRNLLDMIPVQPKELSFTHLLTRGVGLCFVVWQGPSVFGEWIICFVHIITLPWLRLIMNLGRPSRMVQASGIAAGTSSSLANGIGPA